MVNFSRSLAVVNSTMEVGQKVRVRRLRDRVPDEVINLLGQIGTIEGYKIVDGSGVGVTVRFNGQIKAWFFEDELETVA